MKRFPTLAIFALAACVASAQYHGSKEVPKEFAAGFKAITIEDAKAWLGYLAGPECEGRGSGQDGFLKAADFMAAKFKEFGLKPMGDKDSYFQYVPYGRGTVKSGSIKLGEKEFALDEALSLNGFLESKTMTRKTIVFLAAKGEAATLDTYNLKDQVVVANLEGVSREFRRALNASGAAMIILVTDTISSNHSTQVFGALPTPSGRITADLAKTMATAAGVAMPVLEDGKVNALIGLENATITVDVETERKDMPNVVGLLEGSDKTLKAEYIGIGAHLDHLGKRGDVIYYGADDDGSGSTALLGVMKAMHVNKLKPKRSILFMAFTGEESGLIGSGYLANNPPVPLDKMICELQMDMVGRNSEGIQNGDAKRNDNVAENVETIRLVGSKRISTGLDALIQDTNSQFMNFKFKYDAEDVYTRSDHYNFAAKGVPIAFLFDGFHPDYHRPTDTVDKINFDKLTNAAKLYYLVALKAANQPAPFVKDVAQSAGK